MLTLEGRRRGVVAQCNEENAGSHPIGVCVSSCDWKTRIRSDDERPQRFSKNAKNAAKDEVGTKERRGVEGDGEFRRIEFKRPHMRLRSDPALSYDDR